MFNFFKNKNADELERYDVDISSKKQELELINQSICDAKRKLDSLNAEIDVSSGVIEMQDMGMEFDYDELSINEYEKKISSLQRKLALMISNKEIFNMTREYRIDGSYAKGKKFQEDYCKNLLIGLDAYIRQKEKAVTDISINRNIELIKHAYTRFNVKANMIGVSINRDYIDIRIDIMREKLKLKNAKAEEREQIREEKRKIAEEEKFKAEAEKEKARLAMEKARWEKVFGDAMTDEKREEAKAKLEEISNRDAKVDYRLSNLKSGWVYVLTNPCLSGLCKIGTTKRLDFTKRVNELNAAGVPYDFVVEGVVFSDDCFALESALHKRFDSQRENKINRHKEFFRVDAKYVLDVMRTEYNCDIHFGREDEDN